MSYQEKAEGTGASSPGDFSRFFSPLANVSDRASHPFRVFAILIFAVALVLCYQAQGLVNWADFYLQGSSRVLVMDAAEALVGFENQFGIPQFAQAHRNAIKELRDNPMMMARANASEPVEKIVPDAEKTAPTPDAEVTKEKPKDRTYRIMMIGDSLGQGIGAGLSQVFKSYENVQFVNKTRHATGLARNDYFDWEAHLDKLLAQNKVDAMVIVFGTNDGQPMYLDKRHREVVRFDTENWNELYRQRVEGIARRLAEKKIKAFWVGLPVMRLSSLTAKVQHINDLVRETVSAHDIVYINTYDLTADTNQAYSSYMTGKEGKMYRVRAEDGIHFNMRGYILLAEHVVDVMKNYLTLNLKQEGVSAQK